MKRAPLWPWFCIGALVTGVALALGASFWQAMLVNFSVAVVLQLARWRNTS